MRPRFGIAKGDRGRNEILSSVVRGRYQREQFDEWKSKRQLRESQRFTRDTLDKDYRALKDNDVGGVMELAIIKADENGNRIIDDKAEGQIVVGGREHTLQKGMLRIIDKKAVDQNLDWIVERREFKDSIMSAIMSDRSGQICRMMLPQDRYDALKSDNPNFQTMFPGQTLARDIIEADGRPEMFMLFHEASKEFALALHKLSLVVDNTEITFSEGIDEWTSKYSSLKRKSVKDGSSAGMSHKGE